MGRRSEISKKEKRKAQKLKRKLKFSSTHRPTSDCETSQADCSTCTTNDSASDPLDDILGEDIDAVEMRLEDAMEKPDTYSHEYLCKCRRRLLHKVEYYRRERERSRTDTAILLAKHREEIERVRHFYQTIAYARTRSGEMVKSVMEKSLAAENIAKQLK